MLRSGSVVESPLIKVISYGTSSPMLTFTSGVVFVSPTAESIDGSSATWLLKIWAEPGAALSSNVKKV